MTLASAVLRWPAPALLAWAAAWALHLAVRRAAWPEAAAFTLALLVPLLIAMRIDRGWRRAIVAAGFPLSWLALHAQAMPAWTWLVAAAALAVAYPARAWRDAPFFPTRHDALLGLPSKLGLPPSPRVLDAGCGAGDGLLALRAAWPDAVCEGVEWSRPLAWLTRLRCPFARVRRGDLWADDWSGWDVVYVFQRPESMPRAWDKARAQMREGAWLVSLEFTVPGVRPTVTLEPADGGRPVHAWCIVHDAATQSTPAGADNPGRSHASLPHALAQQAFGRRARR